jgi:hypothetical protein
MNRNGNIQFARGKPLRWALIAASLILAANFLLDFEMSRVFTFHTWARPSEWWESALGCLVPPFLILQFPSIMVSKVVCDVFSFGDAGWVMTTTLVSCVMYCPAAVYCCWWCNNRKHNQT